MSDHQDAAPSQPGEKVTPEHVVAFFLMPDGSFGMDCTNDEQIGRYLVSHGFFELDRYYQKKRMEQAFEKIRDEVVVNQMLGEDAAKITRKLRGLKR